MAKARTGMPKKKPTIVLLHGFRGTKEGVQEIAEILQEKYSFEVLTPNIPPAGKAKLKVYTPESYADFVQKYIKEHKLDKPVIVGHSMGSIITSALAEYHPDVINHKMILMSPISVKPYKFIANLQPLVTILPNSVCSFLSTRYLFIPKNRELYKKTLKLVNICGADYINSQVVREAARFSTSYTVADFNFDKETLLISGDKDRLVSIKYTKKLASEKNYEIKVIKDAGHLINYERPDKVAKIIADFLAQ